MNINIKDYYIVIELTIDFDRNIMTTDIYFEMCDGDYIECELYIKESILSGQRTLGPWEYRNISSIVTIVNKSRFVKETGLSPSEYINNIMNTYSDIRSDTNTAIYIIRKRASEIAK